MKIFSLQGIVMLVVYLAVLDRVADAIPALKAYYTSPFAATGFEMKKSVAPVVVGIAVAAVLVTMTPRIF